MGSAVLFHEMNSERASRMLVECKKREIESEKEGRKTHLLAETGLHILSFSTMDKSGIFVVKAVQSMRLLVDEGVVLRHELPPDFRRNNGVVLGVAGGG